MNKALIGTAIAFLIGWGGLQVQVKNNKEDIKELEPAKEQITRIDTRQQTLNEQLTNFQDDYKRDQEILQEDIKAILRHVR